jgi:AmiR/NasT family two-component response regulator
MAARVREAVADRAQVEQAKGVLAHQEQVDMAEAYERLVRRARDGGRGLAQTAELIVRSTYEPPSGDA